MFKISCYVRFVGDTDNDDGFNLIQPSLIQQLKSILNQYPDDGQILKVLLAATKNYLLITIKEKKCRHTRRLRRVSLLL